MTTGGPPPGDRTLSRLIRPPPPRTAPTAKAGPQEPCTWPGPDRWHVARFKGIGMTHAERRTVEVATRTDPGRDTGPKGYLVGELGPYHAGTPAGTRPRGTEDKAHEHARTKAL